MDSQTDCAQSARRIAATYNYTDENGNLLYQVVRYEPKGFTQRQPKANGGWNYSLNGVRRVLYRLPNLVASKDIVWVVEGEKDADRLASLGLTATTCAMGAGKWLPEYTLSLKCRHVVVLPDNDEVGLCHAREIVYQLRYIASSAVVVELPNLLYKGDVSDWLNATGDKNALIDLAILAEERAMAK